MIMKTDMITNMHMNTNASQSPNQTTSHLTYNYEFKYDLDTTCYNEISETESETHETQKIKFKGQ